MAYSRDIRRCALQALYQFDAGAVESPEQVRESLADSPGSDDVHQRGFDLACAAWEARAAADANVAKLTPDWPTHRQPVIDRNILRLAYYEMASGLTPPKVAINEAVELAHEFSTDKSPLFINGVLDKIMKQLRASNLEVDTVSSLRSPSPSPSPSETPAS
jgi:transcription antitermination protein NusB